MSEKFETLRGDPISINADSSKKSVWILGLNNTLLEPREAINIAESIIEQAKLCHKLRAEQYKQSPARQERK